MARRNQRIRSSTVRKAGPKSKGAVKNTGKINSRQKVVDGIQFKSLLEVFTYRKLKELDLNFQYEEKRFVLMSGFHYPNQTWENRTNGQDFSNKGQDKVRDITYTPDFIGYDEEGNMTWVIECKGFANERFPNVWKMFKQTLMREGNAVPLFLPKNQKQVLQILDLIINL